MIKLIVSDLDGTLLNHDRTITPSERQALHEAKANRIEWCLASGRVHADIRKVMEEIGFITHSISQNGAIVRTKEGDFLHSAAFDARTARRIHEIAESFPLFLVSCSAEESYILVRNSDSERIQARMFSEFTVRPDLRHIIGTELKICKFSIFGDMSHLLELKNRLESDSVQDRIMTFIADSDCLDIVPSEVSKGAGVQTLCRFRGFRPEEVACIGDNFNDVPMFRFTPNSFAIKGSHDEVMAAARHSVVSVGEAVQWVLRYNRFSFLYRALNSKP